MLDAAAPILPTLRRWMLALLSFGLVGTATELILLEHYEDAWQLVPLFLLALAFAVVAWHLARSDKASLRALQTTMALFVVAGFAGIGLHFLGAAEFQWDIDASQSGWVVFKKAMRAKAPPVLAPGLMIQLGLLGLAYTYRCPLRDDSGPADPFME